jgi:hypothetical protein
MQQFFEYVERKRRLNTSVTGSKHKANRRNVARLDSVKYGTNGSLWHELTHNLILKEDSTFFPHSYCLSLA